ncbi:hypothetical protein C8R31_101148 [Nitrosospira sp. Nsp2]|nr:hypothetical protein C8R31_101148 [Nitrosospira sp. Nsp2]
MRTRHRVRLSEHCSLGRASGFCTSAVPKRSAGMAGSLKGETRASRRYPSNFPPKESNTSISFNHSLTLWVSRVKYSLIQPVCEQLDLVNGDKQLFAGDVQTSTEP